VSTERPRKPHSRLRVDRRPQAAVVITGMIHGQADEIVRQFRKLRAEHEAAAAQPARAMSCST